MDVTLKDAIQLVWDLSQPATGAVLLAIGLKERVTEIGLEGVRQELQFVLEGIQKELAQLERDAQSHGIYHL